MNGTRLEQVLMNLMLNAAHATVEAERSAPVRVEVDGADAGGRVRVRVIDRGVGIPPADMERVFEPYYTTKPPGKGTGLGLTVVRQIVESYRGRVTIASVVGEGTTVAFDLPATSEPL
jgi:signal transduction histidine kinase